MTAAEDARRGSPLRRALRQPRFRRLFLARTISQWGDTFNAVALVILVYRLTGSGVKVALTVGFEVIPVLGLGFIAGAVADRVSRRRVMVTADLGRALIAVALVVGQHHLWAVYAAALGMSCFAVFFNPAASSALPSLVVRGDLLGANTAIWSAAVLSQIVLAPLAGVLIALVGPGAAFALNGGSFVVSAALLASLELPTRPRSEVGSRTREIAEGFRLVRRVRLLSTLAVVQLLAALSAGATSALLVVLAERHLRVGAAGFGWLLAAIGVGAGLGPLVIQRFATDTTRPTLLFAPYLLRGVVDWTLAASSNFILAAGALGVYGVGTSTGNVAYQSRLQAVVPDRLLGRVFAFYDVVWQSSRLLSIAVGGILADRFGIRAVYVLGGGLLIAAGAVGLARERSDSAASSHPIPRSPASA